MIVVLALLGLGALGFAIASPSTDNIGGFAAPVPLAGTVVTTAFGGQHRGVDLAVSPGGGEPVHAVEAGVVVRVDTPQGSHGKVYGNAVEVLAPSGRRWSYRHMRNRPRVQKGQQVLAGTHLGAIGATGASRGSHLHIAVKNPDGAPTDPAQFFKHYYEDRGRFGPHGGHQLGGSFAHAKPPRAVARAHLGCCTLGAELNQTPVEEAYDEVLRRLDASRYPYSADHENRTLSTTPPYRDQVRMFVKQVVAQHPSLTYIDEHPVSGWFIRLTPHALGGDAPAPSRRAPKQQHHPSDRGSIERVMHNTAAALGRKGIKHGYDRRLRAIIGKHVQDAVFQRAIRAAIREYRDMVGPLDVRIESGHHTGSGGWYVRARRL